jgi:hypothetical protein
MPCAAANVLARVPVADGRTLVSARAVMSFDSEREGGMRDEKGEGYSAEDTVGRG